jgi:hypothetical protein
MAGRAGAPLADEADREDCESDGGDERATQRDSRRRAQQPGSQEGGQATANRDAHDCQSADLSN